MRIFWTFTFLTIPVLSQFIDGSCGVAISTDIDVAVNASVRPIARALVAINDTLGPLDASITVYNGTQENIQAILSNANATLTSFSAASSQVDDAAELNEENYVDLVYLTPYFADLTCSIKTVINDLVRQKALLVKTEQDPVILTELKKQYEAINNLYRIILSHIPNFSTEATFINVKAAFVNVIAPYQSAVASGISIYSTKTMIVTSFASSCTPLLFTPSSVPTPVATPGASAILQDLSNLQSQISQFDTEIQNFTRDNGELEKVLIGAADITNLITRGIANAQASNNFTGEESGGFVGPLLILGNLTARAINDLDAKKREATVSCYGPDFVNSLNSLLYATTRFAHGVLSKISDPSLQNTVNVLAVQITAALQRGVGSFADTGTADTGCNACLKATTTSEHTISTVHASSSLPTKFSTITPAPLSTGLSMESKLGVGFGMSLGFLFLAGILLATYLRRKWRIYTKQQSSDASLVIEKAELPDLSKSTIEIAVESQQPDELFAREAPEELPAIDTSAELPTREIDQELPVRESTLLRSELEGDNAFEVAK